MALHDPRREVEKLRDQLASHDKPIVFLVGAGASSAVKDDADQPLIPSVPALTETCAAAVGALGQDHATAYASIQSDLDTRRISKARPTNIEDILSDLRGKIAAMSVDDTLAGATRPTLETLERTIRETIAAAARPDDARIPDVLPHHSLARWIGRISRACPVEIFTTNYDTLLERGLEDERVAAFDGFVGSRQPFFSSASLLHEGTAPGPQWTRLWKVHGSVNWSWQSLPDGTRRIVRGGEGGGGELILPSFHKYDESRKQPYVAMLDRLTRVLTRREDTLVLTVGYSFGDDHINEVLFDALDVQERMHIVALRFTDPALDDELVKRAIRRRNLIVYGPSRAIVGGVIGEWRLAEPVDERTAGLLDVPFDSDGSPEEGEPALTGRFRLGDFVWLARFLDGITGSD